MFNRLREGFRQERKMQPESESVRSVDDGGHLSRRSSSKVVPGLPRPLTFKRMSSEKREKLLEGPVSPKQRRATSLHQRRGNPPDRIKRDQDDKGNDVYNGSGRDQEEAYETSSVHSAVSTARSDLEAVLADWSGRGAHVDFQSHEEEPLVQGRFLGHGSMGSVFETSVRGFDFALKRRFCRRKIGEAERKEIEILKKLSHRHIIRLAGSYTHRNFLGLLLWPVATCDLATFLEDYEAVMDNSPEDHARGERMIALSAMGDGSEVFEISANSILKCRMGCIISAVEYLHSQNIRHKDLKPSNILLSAGRVFLTDFGTATDFSDRTSSTTEGIERGTPKYFAPEMAAYEGSGRPADIFSLGCVLLEMHTIQQKQRLHTLRDLRAKHDKSFQANHEAIVDWLARPVERESGVDRQIKDTIGWMLSKNPAERPTVGKVRENFALIDTFQAHQSSSQLFMGCCRNLYISRNVHEREIKEAYLRGVNHSAEMKERLTTELYGQAQIASKMEKEIIELVKQHHALQKRVTELQESANQQPPDSDDSVEERRDEQRYVKVTRMHLAEQSPDAATLTPAGPIHRYHSSSRPTPSAVSAIRPKSQVVMNAPGSDFGGKNMYYRSRFLDTGNTMKAAQGA
ncbi:hypothetical protein DPSP01_012796 [Paraphaeosphaeria sporulosa]